jgi:hypothetical protein
MKEPIPKISIITVSWNVRELLRANLNRLLSLPDQATREIIVVDNDSSDGSAEMVRREFPTVRLIRNDWNAGFGKSNNQGLENARGDIVVLLNPDMLVDHGALDRVYSELMADKEIGVLGIRLIGEDGHPISNVRRFPDFKSQLALLLKLNRLWPKVMDSYMANDFDYNRSADVDQVRGAFFAFRRDLLETVGKFDERFFIWFEEVDFCRRVHACGLKVRYLADATAHDFVGRSFAQTGRLTKQRYFTKSMGQYFAKWHPAWQTLVIKGCRPIALVMVAAADLNDLVIKDIMRDIRKR